MSGGFRHDSNQPVPRKSEAAAGAAVEAAAAASAARAKATADAARDAALRAADVAAAAAAPGDAAAAADEIECISVIKLDDSKLKLLFLTQKCTSRA